MDDAPALLASAGASVVPIGHAIHDCDPMVNASSPFPTLPPPTRDGDTIPGPFSEAAMGRFEWPVPPGYLAPSRDARGTACEIDGPRGAKFSGLLIDVDPRAGHALVQADAHAPSVRLRFAEIRRLTLTAPLKLDRSATETRAADRAIVPYRLDVSEDGSVEGRSVSPVRAPFGVFLFPPVDDAGSAVLRTLVPSQAFERLIVGLPARDEDVGSAAADRPNERLEMLRAPPICEPAALLDALARQPKLPPARIGETLLALQLIGDADLERVLGWQRRSPGTPIGELLLRAGVLTPKQLHRAMLRRLGYPVVNIGTFPVELEAVQRVPLKTAARLRVLPLLLREQRIAIAMEDPSRDEVLRELEFASQCTVLPVLAHAGAVGYAMTQAIYERLGADVWLGSVPIGDEAAAATPAGASRADSVRGRT